MEIFSALTERGLLHTCSISEDGRLLEISPSLSEQLGYSRTEIEEILTEKVLTTESLALISKIFANPPADEKIANLEITFIRHTYTLYHVLANGIIDWRNRADPQISLVMVPFGQLTHRLNQLQNANQVMSDMLHSAKVAYWCIEWLNPVDISCCPDEIVRQVFENASHWLMCNRAMAEVYEMPTDMIFSQQPIRLYWPRSPANEEFVRRLIETNFSVNRALSVDRRHDGSPAYVENDVSASIENGHLLRMWGSIRDVSQELEMQQNVEQRIESLCQVFDAVTDAVVIIDQDAQPQWRNAVFEKTFGITQGEGIVQTLLEQSLPDRAWYSLQLPSLNGQMHDYKVHCSVIVMQENMAWKVAVLRMAEHINLHSNELHP